MLTATINSSSATDNDVYSSVFLRKKYKTLKRIFHTSENMWLLHTLQKVLV